MGMLRSLHKRLKKIGSAPLRAGAKIAGKLPGGKKLNRLAGKIPGANRLVGGPLERGEGKKRGLRGTQPGRAMAGRPSGVSGFRMGGVRPGMPTAQKKEGGY